MKQLMSRQFQEFAKDPRYRESIQALLCDYEEAKRETPPPLSARLRSLFLSKGTREEFERPYFKKRSCTAEAGLLALIFPEEEAYLAVLKKYLYSTCREISWALPAHLVNVADEMTCVDLFAAETACMLAEICTALEDRLGDGLVDLIKEQIHRRVLSPYLENAFWWEDGKSNWTAVCCGNIAIAMMRIAPELFEREKDRILHAMAQYISAFPDDGNCPEGMHYWNFGFGRWVWFADVLYAYSEGKCDLFQDEKVKQIAAYAQKMFLKGKATVSISDSDRAEKADAALLSFLHGKYEGCALVPKELTKSDFGDVPWLSRSRYFLYGADVSYPQSLPLRNYLFRDSAQAIVNTERYSLAVKGGHNGESHNHNDVGSFILATDEGQIFCDLGAGRYFNGYFNSDIRYSLINNASWGHSVPIIDGSFQREGRQFCGDLAWDGNEITVDFAEAYGGAATKLKRTFRYDEGRIVLTDEYAGCRELTERFVTVVKPKFVSDGVQVGNVRLTSKDAVPKITESRFERHGYKKRKSEKVYLIDFVFSGKERASFCFTVLDTNIISKNSITTAP